MASKSDGTQYAKQRVQMAEPVYRGLGLLGHNDVRTLPNFHVAFLTLTIRALMGLVKTYVHQISR